MLNLLAPLIFGGQASPRGAWSLLLRPLPASPTKRPSHAE
jgi:hypothetical protein